LLNEYVCKKNNPPGYLLRLIKYIVVLRGGGHIKRAITVFSDNSLITHRFVIPAQAGNDGTA